MNIDRSKDYTDYILMYSLIGEPEAERVNEYRCNLEAK